PIVCSPVATHLPPDNLGPLGNNVGPAHALGLGLARDWFGDVKVVALGLSGAWSAPLTRAEAIGRVAAGVCGGREPRFVFPHGPDVVRKVGLCSGAASDLLESAAQAGCDLYL